MTLLQTPAMIQWNFNFLVRRHTAYAYMYNYVSTQCAHLYINCHRIYYIHVVYTTRTPSSVVSFRCFIGMGDILGIIIIIIVIAGCDGTCTYNEFVSLMRPIVFTGSFEDWNEACKPSDESKFSKSLTYE